jgi:hypothetical protein
MQEILILLLFGPDNFLKEIFLNPEILICENSTGSYIPFTVDDPSII